MRAVRTATRSLVALLVAISIRAAIARAQTPDSLSSFARASYGIVPTLTGLSVVRGQNEERVASLAFLWPNDVTPAFAADSAALRHAQRATKIRLFGAMMSSTGIAVIATGVVTGLGPGGSFRSSAILTLVGAGIIGTSIPVHFASDAELSRAVWHYNAHLESSMRARAVSY